MARLYPFRGLTALVAIALPWRLRSRQERQSHGAVGGGPHSRRAITAPKPLEPGAGSTLIVQLRAADAADRERRHERRAHALAAARSRHRRRASQQIVHQADQIAPGGDGRTAYRLPAPLGAGLHLLLAHARGRRRQHRPLLGGLELQRRAAGRDRRAGRRRRRRARSRPTSPSSRSRNGAISGTTGVVYRFDVRSVGGLQHHDRGGRDRRARTAAAPPR